MGISDAFIIFNKHLDILNINEKAIALLGLRLEEKSFPRSLDALLKYSNFKTDFPSDKIINHDNTPDELFYSSEVLITSICLVTFENKQIT